MNIVSRERKYGRLIDGIYTILSLNDEDFNQVIDRLGAFVMPHEKINLRYADDDCFIKSNPVQYGLEKEFDENNRRIGRWYTGGNEISISMIIEQLKHIQESFPKDSVNYRRIDKLVRTRDFDAYKNFIRLTGIGGKNVLLLDKTLEILTSEEAMERFIDYENNRDFFRVGFRDIEQKEYIKELGKFFPYKFKDTFSNRDLSENFYVPEYFHMLERVKNIYEKTNADSILNPRFDFRITGEVETIFRKNDLPQFNVDESLKRRLIGDMPSDLSPEEKAMYLYLSMCKTFRYNQEYMYRDKINSNNFDFDFNPEYLEKITSDSKITCYEFAMIFAKIANELDPKINALAIGHCRNMGHFSCGFYTDKVSTRLDAVNIDPNEPINDISRAKLNRRLKGINIISDRNDLIGKALDKIYPLVYGKIALDEMQKEEQRKSLTLGDNIYEKLRNFISILKGYGIYENEFVQTLADARKANYFGDSVEFAYAERRKTNSVTPQYQRVILLRERIKEGRDKEEYKENQKIYVIDTGSLEMKATTRQQVMDALKSGALTYEDPHRHLEDVEK